MSSSMLLHDVIMTSFSLQCCLQCLLCKIMGSSDEDKILIKNLHCSKGYRGYGVKKTNEFPGKRLKQKWTVMQRRVCQRQIHSADELKRRLIDVWCGLEQSIFDEAIDQWRGRHRACVHVKEGHFEYSLWTDNVDFVHICYITFSVTCLTVASLITKACQQRWPIHSILVHFRKYSALADLGYGVRF